MQERGAYFVGPLARYNLNFDRLSRSRRRPRGRPDSAVICRNPFQSIIVRAVEMLYACDEALRIIEQYEPPEQPRVRLRVRARGRLWLHRSAPRHPLPSLPPRRRGIILDAKIVPPTSQNQKTIEDDLWDFVAAHLASARTSELHLAVRAGRAQLRSLHLLRDAFLEIACRARMTIHIC